MHVLREPNCHLHEGEMFVSIPKDSAIIKVPTLSQDSCILISLASLQARWAEVKQAANFSLPAAQGAGQRVTTDLFSFPYSFAEIKMKAPQLDSDK